MNEHDTPEPSGPSMEPEDLDGHTVEELSDYLDADRVPANPSIDRSPGCRIALDAMERLRALSPELLIADTADEPEPDEGWVQSILAGITLDARAGRRVPVPAPGSNADLGITEGAIRGVIRAAENDVPGVIVGRCRLDGEVTEPGEPVRVFVEVSIAHGERIPTLLDRLRTEIASRLAAHTPLNVTGIDIAVHDLHQLPNPQGGDR
ncbi:hypothetical protein [Leucobacter sp. wl10]|uniref:hypothetical protein n=1 Tax=Leucobacter sp. wl10 TaxID=2304677 RepID=UPI000E5BC088|nr:hypothetical protein [Leucobacter sp. wl10]RGE20427.1 hypothetical protein D1J51_09435 [Leucobacter sp. wl10]